MKKRNFIATLSVFLSALILTTILIWMTPKFFVPAFQLFVITDNVDYTKQYSNSWECKDSTYRQAVSERSAIAEKSDIAKWLVFSGSSRTGKIVRAIVLVCIAAVDFCTLIFWYVILANARRIKRLICKRLQKRKLRKNTRKLYSKNRRSA